MSTGTTLFEKNAHQRMPTSSMSKIMTMYMVFERIRSGRLSLDDTMPVSQRELAIASTDQMGGR